MSSGATSIYPQDNLNSPNSSSEQVYEFDRFRLDVAHRMLYENGQAVALAPKVVETLIALVEKRGELVSKDELMNRVWADAIVEESNLTQNIYLLRKALGNGANNHPIIESFRRRGYRFNGEVRVRESASHVIEAEPSNGKTKNDFNGTEVIAEVSPHSLVSPGPKRTFYFVSGAIAVCVLVIAVLLIQSRSFRAKTANPSAAILKISRLTPDLNIFGAAAFTPDGTHLAYVLNDRVNRSMWLKDLTTGSDVQILPPVEKGYGSPVFSSDGKTIYYATNRKDAPNGTIVRQPIEGGVVQKVAVDAISPFTLSPDEKQLAFINGKMQLIVAQTDGKGEHLLAERDRKRGWFESWNSTLSWSPDGQRLAVCGGEDTRGKRKAELLEVSAGDGTIKLIPIPDWETIDDVIWLRDQTGLLVLARETATAPFQIWKVAYPGGAATRITNDTNNYVDIAMSADSRRIVATQYLSNTNIWTTTVEAPWQAKQLTVGSTASDGVWGVAFASNGKIVYTSPRDRNIDIWAMNPDGSEQKQLTKNAGEFNGQLSVTPDGRTIVFTSSRSGKTQIWRMDADGANPQQLTDADIGAAASSLSPDGSWVYFTLVEGRTDSIWKVPIKGGAMIRVSLLSGIGSSAFAPAASLDGKFIGFALYDGGAVQPWKVGLMRATDGTLVKIFDVACNRHISRWTTDSRALICINDGATNLWQLPVDGSPVRLLTSFENGSISNFALSPDGKRFVIARGNPSNEAVLLENFWR